MYQTNFISRARVNKLCYFLIRKRQLHINHIIHIDAIMPIRSFTVHAVVDQLKHLITPDMTESACTTVCESVIAGIGLLVCPSACNM